MWLSPKRGISSANDPRVRDDELRPPRGLKVASVTQFGKTASRQWPMPGQIVEAPSNSSALKRSGVD